MTKIATYNDVNNKLGGGVLNGTKCVTKEVLSSSYNINDSLLNSYSDNQLVPLDNIELINIEPAWITTINNIARNGGHKIFIGWNLSSTSPTRDLLVTFKNISSRTNSITLVSPEGAILRSALVDDRTDNNGNYPFTILAPDDYFILYKSGNSSQAYASGGLFSSGPSWRNEDYTIKYGGLIPWLEYTDSDSLVCIYANGTYPTSGIKSLKTSYYNKIDSIEYAGQFFPIKETSNGVYGLYLATNQSNKNSGIVINKGDLYNVKNSLIGSSTIPYAGVQTSTYGNAGYIMYSYTKNRRIAIYIDSSNIRYPFYLTNGQWDTSIPISITDSNNVNIFEYGGKMYTIDNSYYGIIQEYTTYSYEQLFDDKYIVT